MKRTFAIVLVLALLLLAFTASAQEVTPEPAATEAVTAAPVVDEAPPAATEAPIVVVSTPSPDNTSTYVVLAFAFLAILVNVISGFLQNRTLAEIVSSAIANTQRQLDNPSNARVIHDAYANASPAVQELINVLLKGGDMVTDLLPGTDDDKLVERAEAIIKGEVAPAEGEAKG